MLYELKWETDYIVCRNAVIVIRKNFGTFEWSPHWPEHKIEAKRRGYLPSDCGKIAREGPITGRSVEANANAKNKSPPSIKTTRSAASEKARHAENERLTRKAKEEAERKAAIEAEAKRRQRLMTAQLALQVLGIYGGTADGVLGSKTRAAIDRWLKANGMATGIDLTEEIVARIAQQAEAANVRRMAKLKAAKKKRLAARNKRLDALRKKHRHAVAVIIGNRDYQGRTPDVLFAANDADAMRQFTTKNLGYRDGNIIDLRDATLTQLNATFGTVDNYRGRLFDYVRPGKSDVIVFYSGHGVPGSKNRRGYLLPINADPNRVELNGYPLDTLLSNLAKIPARSMSVYLDACFSGESESGTLVRSTSGITIQAKMPSSAAHMTVITAARNDQFASWDEDAKHGLFTKHLLAALMGEADSEDYGDGDGKVTLAELKAYLDEEMTYQARRRYSRDQKATVQGNLNRVLATLR